MSPGSEMPPGVASEGASTVMLRPREEGRRDALAEGKS